MKKYRFLMLAVSLLCITCITPPNPVSPVPDTWPVTVYVKHELYILPHWYSETYSDMTVSGEGITPFGLRISSADPYIMINVPAGTSRLFECRRYVKDSQMLIDTGSMVADVKPKLTSLTLTLAPITPPVITAEPEDFSLIYHGYGWFRVQAEGLDLRYTWQKNNIDLLHANYNSFGRLNDPCFQWVSQIDSGSTYRCIVCNFAGCDTSRSAVLSVLPDTVPPKIILLDSTTEVYLDSLFDDSSTTFAYDSMNYDLTDEIIRSGTVTTSIEGTYTITYSVSDSSGNTATAIRTVVVRPYTEEDRSRPVITIVDTSSNYKFGSEYYFYDNSKQGVSAFDLEDGDIIGTVVVSELEPIYPGLQYCTYNVTDSDGNAAKTRYRLVHAGYFRF